MVREQGNQPPPPYHLPVTRVRPRFASAPVIGDSLTCGSHGVMWSRCEGPGLAGESWRLNSGENHSLGHLWRWVVVLGEKSPTSLSYPLCRLRASIQSHSQNL